MIIIINKITIAIIMVITSNEPGFIVIIFCDIFSREIIIIARRGLDLIL